jgi:glycosyltransferase involved in cell wall biosynthesis
MIGSMGKSAETAGDGIEFSLVVLCYRSEEGIVPVVEKLHEMLSFYKFRYELLLVGNYLEGSSDGTPGIVTELARRIPNTRAVVFPKRGMMGWDMRKGLEEARGEFICVIDGDGQFPLESIFSCLIKIMTENLDMVKTYRVRREDGFFRAVVSHVYNFVFNLLYRTDFRDVNSKPKILRRDKYLLMDLKSDDWFIDAEIMIRANQLGLRIVELPIHFYAIRGRKSFVKPQAILEFMRNLWDYRSRRP